MIAAAKGTMFGRRGHQISRRPADHKKAVYPLKRRDQSPSGYYRDFAIANGGKHGGGKIKRITEIRGGPEPDISQRPTPNFHRQNCENPQNGAGHNKGATDVMVVKTEPRRQRRGDGGGEEEGG